MVKIIFYGGVNEIGGNKILLEDNGKKIFLDFGTSFGREGEFFEFPILRPASKEDLFKINILPRIPGLFLHQGLDVKYDKTCAKCLEGSCEPKGIDGIILSHAHMDHYGYLALIRDDIPVMMSKVTKRMLEIRNHTVNEMWTNKIGHLQIDTIEKNRSEDFNGFEIKRFDVDHSVLGASGFMIKKGETTIAYTGDLRFHGLRGEMTGEFLKGLKNEHIDILLCEGTRIGKVTKAEQKVEEHTLATENQVHDKLFEITRGEDGLIIYDASPADFDRIRTVWKVAKKTGRKLILDSRKAYMLLYLNAEERIVEDLPTLEDFKICLGRLKLRSDIKKFTDVTGGRDVFVESYEDYRTNHEKELLVKQYLESYNSRPYNKNKQKTIDDLKEEWENPFLFEIEDDNFVWGPHCRDDVLKNANEYILYTSNGPLTLLQFKPLNVGINGTYVYGKAEPFSEEMEFSFGKLLNWLKVCGLKLEYAHTSGHMNRKDLEFFINEVAPKKLMPVHTEYPKEFRKISKSNVEVVYPKLSA
jgi:ribonuclease J